MARPSSPRRVDRSRLLTFSEWLYAFCLRMYPAHFRRVYGLRMLRVFRDSCRQVLQRRGLPGLGRYWLYTLMDLAVTACLERWYVLQKGIHTMVIDRPVSNFTPRLWMMLVSTVLAFVVSLVASLNLYLLEDANPLTRLAYSDAPLLRFSYDGIYLSALVAGVMVCAVFGYALLQRENVVRGMVVGVALLVVLGGFGGLLVRYPLTFLAFLGIFLVLAGLCWWVGRIVTARLSEQLVRRSAAVLGACVGVVLALLVNGVALVLHTLILNPVSHNLYMQGQIEGTHLNFTLLVMALAVFTLAVCSLSLGRALSQTGRQ